MGVVMMSRYYQIELSSELSLETVQIDAVPVRTGELF
jgi:hypothetical protein